MEELDDGGENGSIGLNGNALDGEIEHGSKELREQDRFLPIANVTKIMKRPVPRTGKVRVVCSGSGKELWVYQRRISYFQIAKDARECIQECLSEFISFITSEASDRCAEEKRKTINGEDVIAAMSQLGFDNYVEPLKVYLARYREATKGGKSAKQFLCADLILFLFFSKQHGS